MDPIIDNEPLPGEPPAVTLSRRQRLLQRIGSFYGISFGIAMLMLSLFSWLAQEVLEQEFAEVNRAILLWIHSFTSPTLTTLAFAFTGLGSVIGVVVLALCFGMLLLRMRHYWDMVVLAVVLIGGALLVFVLKNVFQQIRPDVFTPLAVELNFSFPSGHSLISFCFWGFFSAWLIRQNPRELWRWIAGMLGLAMAALVALSRLYLGVHWPTDVLAGMLVATFWVTACLSGHRWLTDRRARRISAGAVI